MKKLLPALSAAMFVVALSVPLFAPVASASAPGTYEPWRLVQPYYSNYGNGQFGDCVAAAAGALIQTWKAEEGKYSGPVDAAPLLTLYRRDSPLNDGMLVSQLATWWLAHPIDETRLASAHEVGLSRAATENTVRSLGGEIVVADLDDVNATGWAYEVPGGWRANQGGFTLKNSPLPANPNNPHAMAVVGYDKAWVFVVFAGGVQPVSWSWFRAYVAYAWAFKGA